jgi:hypothetical protein
MRLQHNYFFSKTMALFLLPGVVLLMSCASDKNTGQITKTSTSVSTEKSITDKDYSGTYKISDTEICDFIIIIVKSNTQYTYTIKGTGYKSSGKLSFEMQDDETYINFSGTLRSGDKSPVTGSYQNKKIVIQNYGNSMNQFVCFKSCDSKYLEFVKAE